MLASHVGMKYLPGVRFIARLAATSKNSFNQTSTKSSTASCPYPTMSNPTAKATKADGFLSTSKKCPTFCSYLNCQCPPLVSPIVIPKVGQTSIKMPANERIMRDTSKGPTVSDIPFIGVLAYHLAIFGAKLCVAGYIVKWTIDKGIWGSNGETSEMWARFISETGHRSSQFHVMNNGEVASHSLAEFWNRGIVTAFDTTINTAKWIKAMGFPAFQASDSKQTASMTESFKSSIDSLSAQWWTNISDNNKIPESNNNQTDTPVCRGTEPACSLSGSEEELSLEKESIYKSMLHGEHVENESWGMYVEAKDDNKTREGDKSEGGIKIEDGSNTKNAVAKKTEDIRDDMTQDGNKTGDGDTNDKNEDKTEADIIMDDTFTKDVGKTEDGNTQNKNTEGNNSSEDDIKIISVLAPENKKCYNEEDCSSHSDEIQERADFREQCCHLEMIDKLHTKSLSLQELPAPCLHPDCPLHALNQAAALVEPKDNLSVSN